MSMTNNLEQSERFSLIRKEDEFKQNYRIYRYGLNYLDVNGDIRKIILAAIADNKKFVHLGDHTIFTASISAIEPLPMKYKPLGINEFIMPDGKHIFNKDTGEKRRIE